MSNLSAQTPPPSTRVVWVDFLRVFSTFLVVLAHIDGWGETSKSAQVFYYTLSRIGVPFFFMISGYLLLSRQEDTWAFLKKRAWKILIPFVFWSVLYDLYINQPFAESGFSPMSIVSELIRILRSPRAIHLWFFYPLIGLYLFTPILRLFVAKAKRADLLYYIALWVLAVPVVFILNAFTPIKIGIEIQFAAGYVGYYLMGLVLGRMEVTPRVFWAALATLVAGFGFTFYVMYYNLPSPQNEIVFRSYLGLNMIAMSVAAFLLLKAAGQRLSPKLLPALDMLGVNSFGMYLVHYFVLLAMAYVWQSLGFDLASGPAALVIPLVALVGFALSFAAAYILRKVPFGRYLAP